MVLRLDEFLQPMQVVYTLEKKLEKDPDYVARVQALTLNTARPSMGLKGRHGLFASAQWWRSIRNGSMPQLVVSGVIQRAYFAGQDSRGPNNTVEVLTATGTVEQVGIYIDQPRDVRLFQVGRHVAIVYALDELKQQPAADGGVNYSKVALEMAVSIA